MYLVRLLYVSKVVKGFSTHDIDALLHTARQHNAQVGITGILAFNGEYFMQILEGDRRAVNKLYHHISTDPRHEQLLLLQMSEIDERLFAEWSMAYVPISKLTRDLLLRYGINEDFHPPADEQRELSRVAHGATRAFPSTQATDLKASKACAVV